MNNRNAQHIARHALLQKPVQSSVQNWQHVIQAVCLVCISWPDMSVTMLQWPPSATLPSCEPELQNVTRRTVDHCLELASHFEDIV